MGRFASVVDELRAPGDVGEPVVAREPRADGLHDAPPEAATTAATIFT